jgi:hypothetical protein
MYGERGTREENDKINFKEARCGFDLFDSGYGLAADSCEHGRRSLPFIKGREFLQQQRSDLQTKAFLQRIGDT